MTNQQQLERSKMFYVANLTRYNGIVYLSKAVDGCLMTSNRDDAEIFTNRDDAKPYQLLGHILPCNDKGEVPAMTIHDFYATECNMGLIG